MPFKSVEKRRKWERDRRRERKLAMLEKRERELQAEILKGAPPAFPYDIPPKPVGEVSKDELRQVFEYQAYRALAAITDEDIEESSLQSKVRAAVQASEHALLLSGQPTEIVSIKELAKLDELSGLLLAELKRRSTPALPEAIDVTPEAP